MGEWPRNWAELTRGIGCEMCESGRPDANRYGVRILAGRYAAAYLQRADVQRGYTLVIWHGRHVNEPTELDDVEAAGYWAEVLTVARALMSVYEPPITLVPDALASPIVNAPPPIMVRAVDELRFN